MCSARGFFELCLVAQVQGARKTARCRCLSITAGLARMQGGLAQVFAAPESQSYRLSRNGPPGLWLRPAGRGGPFSRVGFCDTGRLYSGGALLSPSSSVSALAGLCICGTPCVRLDSWSYALHDRPVTKAEAPGENSLNIDFSLALNNCTPRQMGHRTSHTILGLALANRYLGVPKTTSQLRTNHRWAGAPPLFYFLNPDAPRATQKRSRDVNGFCLVKHKPPPPSKACTK